MIKADSTILATDFITTLIAGEALAIRDALYISAADGKVYKTDTSNPTKVNFYGFAQEAAILNASVNVHHDSHLGGFSGLTINGDIWLGASAGSITQTKPTATIPARIGYASSASIVRIDKIGAVQTFLASGTYTIPPWATMLFVEGWGGGSSGACARGNTGSAEAGGGAGGGHIGSWIPISKLGGVTTVTVTIGLGGVAANIASGTSDATAVATAGGNTTFGTFLTAGGGAIPGVSIANETAVLGGSPGTTSGGTLNVLASNGASGGNATSVGAGSASVGGASTDAGGGGAGACADSSSGGAYSAAGGVSTFAGSGGASVAAYQTGSGVLQAGDGVTKSGGGGAAAYQCSGGAGARQLISGKGGDGMLTITAM